MEPALEGGCEHVLKDDMRKVPGTELEHNKDAMDGRCYDNCRSYCWSQRREELVRSNPTEGVGTEVSSHSGVTLHISLKEKPSLICSLTK